MKAKEAEGSGKITEENRRKPKKTVVTLPVQEAGEDILFVTG
ncbi:MULTISPECIES: hypothetical protein [Paenibacillus]|nr:MULTISPECIES: hypothetical protein [Paenibacillus]